MRPAVLALLAALAAALALPAAAAAQERPTRYSLANGCWALRSESASRLVARAGDAYRPTATDPGAAENFRLKATALGKYLLYGGQRHFLATAPAGLGDVLGGAQVAPAGEPSASGDWRVDELGDSTFSLVNEAAGRRLTVAQDGRLGLADASAPPSAGARFTFVQARNCVEFPEVDLSLRGASPPGPTSFGEVRGLVDAHMHHMAFEFLGGRAHCARPWHPYGVTQALVDCPDHYPNGEAAVLENALYGNPARRHDPVGWPTFKDWPHHLSLTHEQSYYRWIERAWRGGLRIFVNLLVENRVLCEIYPFKKNSCDEMASVRLQARRAYELQDYIDAQAGGPGKGFYRIVKDPFEARRVINQGKLAVILGMETSRPFGCGLRFDTPTCDEAQIDREIAELHALGVRQLELVNKFDNALTGVAGDGGETGTLTNSGNFYETGRFFDLEQCSAGHDHDHSPTAAQHNNDALIGNGLRAALPGGSLPVYGPGPHCNRRGLSKLGEHALLRIIQRKMIFDPDHMSVRAREQALTFMEGAHYPGLVSSHSWSTDGAYPRIYAMGGFIAPYAGGSEGFVRQWRKLKGMWRTRNRGGDFSIGYGADMNGFGSQGGPRGEGTPNPVRYPFRSFDGKVLLDKNRSGERVFDINTDGVAHYGLYPDWVEDLRQIAGREIVDDLARGAEGYLGMWERAQGIRAHICRQVRGRFTRLGVGQVRVGATPVQTLRAAGQPASRPNRTWRWCTKGDRDRSGRITAAFSPRGRVLLVASTTPGHHADGIGIGAPERALAGRARQVSSGVYLRSYGKTRYVYVVRRGRVRAVAAATGATAARVESLRSALKLARVI